MIKLRPSVHFAPLANGVFFKNWDRSFRLAGHASLYPIFERFLPHLERGVERAALVDAVPAGARAVVERMLDQLDAHGMVVDLSGRDAAAIAPDEVEACAGTLAYLEGVAADPWAAFRRLRAARVALVGGGVAVQAAARALAGMHVGALACWATPDDVGPLAACLAEAPRVAGAVRARGDDDDALAAEAWTLVVQIEAAPDREALRAVAARVPGPLLQAVIGDELGVVGPLRDGRTGAGLALALARLRAPLGDAGARSPLMAGLVGNVIALEAVKIVAGLPAPTGAGRCAVVASRPLAATFHEPAPRAPDAPVDAPAALAEARALPPLGNAALVEALQALADERLGLIALPHPGELPQLPVFVQPAAAGDAEVFGWSEDMEAAVARAGLAALAALAGRDAGARRPAWTLTGDPRGAIDPAQAHLAAAGGWDAWLAAGVLGHLCDRLAGPALPGLAPVAREVAPDAVSPRARLHGKTLARRGAVQLQHVQFPALPGVHLAVVTHAGAIAGRGAGLAATAAIEAALLEAVARMQLAAAGRALPPLPPLPPLPIDPRAAEPAVTGSLDDVLAGLDRLGLEVRVHPWRDEPALARRGLQAGWVVIHAR